MSLMTAFFYSKKFPFFGKNSTFTQSDSGRVVSEIFLKSVYSFCNIKGYCK